jgi:DNA-binding transcriptional MerR regulator
MAEAHLAIKVVARRTGWSVHAIRIWEKPYGAVAPERTGTNRRLYSDEQIERLSLLRDITQNGHSIGHVAKLPTDKLRKLATEAHGTNGYSSRALAAPPHAPTFLDECVAAVKSLDARTLERGLSRGRPAAGRRIDAAARVTALGSLAPRRWPRHARLPRRPGQNRRDASERSLPPLLNPRRIASPRQERETVRRLFSGWD